MSLSRSTVPLGCHLRLGLSFRGRFLPEERAFLYAGAPPLRQHVILRLRPLGPKDVNAYSVLASSGEVLRPSPVSAIRWPESQHAPTRVVFLLLLLLLFTSPTSAQPYLSCQLVAGWEQSGATRDYTPDTLYEYMDGNAESYLLYGFLHMQGITCTSGDKKFVIDVSEVQDSDLAYGMFASNADPNQPISKIAMGGQVQPRRASFAKGKYYVEIAASPEGDHTAALQAFISKIEPLVEGRSTPPDALDRFPKENLTSVRLIPESVLGLRQLKRGYVAKYAQGQAFIVIEASPESAAEVFKKVQARVQDATPCSGRSLDRPGTPPSVSEGGLLGNRVVDSCFTAKTPYLENICIFRKGRFIAGYANQPSPGAALANATKLASHLP